MRQLQVVIPKENIKKALKIVKNYSNDVTTSEVEKKDYKATEIIATVDSGDIDEITERLKDIKEIKSGKLSIRVLEQESLIEKGQKTKGSFSILSQEEIYSKAQEVGDFNYIQMILVAASSAIAAIGLVSNSIIAVIGAMMLAPMLAPFIAASISLSIGDKQLFQESMRVGFLSIVVAFLTAYLISLPIQFTMNSALATVLAPGNLAVPLSLIVGVAAALSFTTGFRDQIAGVAVAVALVPPIAAAGITFGAGKFILGFKALNLAIMNLLAVLVAGYGCLRALNIKPSTYYKKKSAENMHRAVSIGLLLIFILGIPLMLTVYDDSLNNNKVQKEAEDYFKEDLILVKKFDRNYTVIVHGNHNETEFRNRFKNENVDMVSLERSRN